MSLLDVHGGPSGPGSTITPQRHSASLRVRCPRTGPGGVVDFGASADRDPLPDSRPKLPGAVSSVVAS
jgi:hypothetical protein